MARILLKQPDGKWAQYSTISDSLIVWDCTKEEMLTFAAKEAAEEAEVRMIRWMGDVESSQPVVRQITWEEAVASHREQYPEDKL